MAPKGKWFCPICVNMRKKRKEKQMQQGHGYSESGGSEFLAPPTPGSNFEFSFLNKSSHQKNDSKHHNFQIIIIIDFRYDSIKFCIGIFLSFNLLSYFSFLFDYCLG